MFSPYYRQEDYKRGGLVLRRRRLDFTEGREKVTGPEAGKSDFAYSAERPMHYGDWFSESSSKMSPYALRERLESALTDCDEDSLRELSKHFFKVSGTYARAAYYLAHLPTYDSMVVPVVLKDSVSEERILSEFVNTLDFLDRMKIKTLLKELALDVIVEGIYYGYLRVNAGNVVMQKLPTEYCRTKYKINGFPVVEFNVRYFDEKFRQEKIKLKVLNSFPPEVVEGYAEFRRGNVETYQPGEEWGAWVTLDPDNAVAFYFNEGHRPLLSNAFFAILDVLELKGIEKKKAEDDLFNLLIQKVPITKEGDFIFDMTEAKAMHSNAAQIFKNTNKTDVLTTFADIDLLNLNDSSTGPMDLTGWKKDVYGDLGISQQLFSTEGNLALEKSLMVDEALIFYLVEKFEHWLNFQIDLRYNRTKTKYYFKAWFPPITANNKVEMSKLYKDHATLGYSKFLPALALGQSQLHMMSSASFENNILKLNNVMEPLRSSHTQSANNKGGRPPKDDSEKADKTIQNQNS